MRKQLLLLTACILPLVAFSQKKADRKILSDLEKHVSVLSDNSTTGFNSSGLLKKAAYLENQFRTLGISPLNNTYRQAVIHNEGKKFFPGTVLSLNGKELQPGKDFIPLSYSAQAEVKGDPLIAVQERGQPWIMDINNYLAGDRDTALNANLFHLTQQAINDKASAVLFYNSRGDTKDPPFNPDGAYPRLNIPVIYINNTAAKLYFSDPTASIKVEMAVAFSEKKDTVYNVIGEINNNASKTILIGACDDGDKATLVELGRLLKSDKHFNRENYILVAFSENKNGTSGIDYFLQHPPVELNQLHCFIHLHHAGAKTAIPPLLIKGRLSPEWQSIVQKIRKKITVREEPASNYSNKMVIPVLTFEPHSPGILNAESEFNVLKCLADAIREINRSVK